MQKLPYRCLYVIKHNQTGLVKIGVSNNWYERAKALQIGVKTSPLVVVLTDNNAKAEKDLHEQYKDYRLPGSEYFQLCSTLVGEVISKALKHGKPLSSWYAYPEKQLCASKALLQQDYVEVTACFHRQLLRQLRLKYRQPIQCVLEFMEMYWDQESIRKFTVYLDIQVQKRKLRERNTWNYKDWYLRLDVCEAYLYRLFNHIRVFMPVPLPVYPEASSDLFAELCFTTVSNCRVISYDKLPLFARILFERTSNPYQFRRDFFAVQDMLLKQADKCFEHYLESYGPYHYTVDRPLPVPNFTGIVNMGKNN